MLEMKQKFMGFCKDNRGSALLSVFMVVTVILVLGMGILALSLGNTNQAKTADTYEKDYYVADGAAKHAVEAVNNAALEQYRLIAIDVKNNGEGTASNNAVDFFNDLAVTLAAYTPVQPDSSAGGPTSVSMQISNNGGSPTRVFTILATATDSKTTRKISSNVSITFKKVTLTNNAFKSPGGETVISGGTFDASNASVSITGTAKFGTLKYKQWNFNYNGNSNPDAATLASLQDTGTAAKFAWKMKYPGYTEEAKTSVTPTLPLITNNSTITNASFKDPPFNWTVPSPIYLEGQSGASFTIDSSLGTYRGGQIYCTGSLTDSAEIDGTSGNYVKIYSTGTFNQGTGQLNYVKVFGDGNVNLNSGPAISNSYIYSKGDITISGRTMNNLTIICDGDLTISGGSSTNVTIYCNGTITDSSNTRTNMKVYCDSYSMSGGNIQGNSIVYAETFMHLESTVRGLFYSNGDITCGNGAGVTGQMAAKGNITTTGYSFTQDSALMAQLNVDPFTTSSPADSSIKIVQPANSDIFTNTPAYSEQ